VCNRKIQWPTIPVWWQGKGYCSDMSNVVSAIDGYDHDGSSSIKMKGNCFIDIDEIYGYYCL
jgi:hypothetical protein